MNNDLDCLPSPQESQIRMDEVWAEESGMTVRITETENGGIIKIEIKKNGSQIAFASLGRWRWDRLACAVAK